MYLNGEIVNELVEEINNIAWTPSFYDLVLQGFIGTTTDFFDLEVHKNQKSFRIKGCVAVLILVHLSIKEISNCNCKILHDKIINGRCPSYVVDFFDQLIDCFTFRYLKCQNSITSFEVAEKIDITNKNYKLHKENDFVLLVIHFNFL